MQFREAEQNGVAVPVPTVDNGDAEDEDDVGDVEDGASCPRRRPLPTRGSPP